MERISKYKDRLDARSAWGILMLILLFLVEGIKRSVIFVAR